MKLCGVGKRFGSRAVLRDISFELFPGTVTLLAGANGAGKSTLMRIMAGLTRPTSGSVIPTFEAARPVTPSPAPSGHTGKAAGSGIGYLGHATFIYPGLSALENLAFWAKLHGCETKREDLLAALKRVDLGRYAEERAGAFSRGMAQRLNLARVLLLAPQILLLDEPGTGLDSHSQGLLRSEIALARARGAAIVWISHDLAGDATSADRLILIADRRIAYDGAPDRRCGQSEAAQAEGHGNGTTELEEAACPDSH